MTPIYPEIEKKAVQTVEGKSIVTEVFSLTTIIRKEINGQWCSALFSEKVRYYVEPFAIADISKYQGNVYESLMKNVYLALHTDRYDNDFAPDNPFNQISETERLNYNYRRKA